MIAVTLIAVLAGSGQVVAQSQQAAKAPAANVFQEQAGKLGVRRCANLFAALGNTVSNGAAYTVVTQAGGAAAVADGHGVQGVVGMAYNTPGYAAQAAGVVIAAPVGTKCEGQLVRVAPFQRACKDVVGQLPAGSTAAGSLSGVPLYILGGNQGQAMLISSGNSCVVVTVARGADVG
ncbi:hypothetical protein OK349_07285 [Sphingomonas sp. BT-65]|uniref:hypothetical protein n=1 Tax=Sphingomonas sp. BT-65 TaxID=2989821 RepID=UPI00223656CE|nr:hypothetical protein [Sphingomonas sp. BT-65]MCW4461507.1 hypothetical protein [Sphingomonas sp. BT-65]